ncbi:MAG TPA: nuclear transport factor 2 family protein [Thermoanaerobaculia bacterium]|nr:nuclear transport factor 2 family protein [Thermoanaerobaculia bacterium]
MAASARTPEELHHLWGEYFVAGDLDGLVSLYEPDAAFVAQSGASVTGLRAIREVLARFIESRRNFEIEVGRAIHTGDLALLVSSWKLEGEQRGEPFETTGRTADVVRRQPDGSWRLVIDSPYGEGA